MLKAIVITFYFTMIFFILLLIFHFGLNNYAIASPNFVRQEIKDGNNDWFFFDEKDKLPVSENDIKKITGSIIGNIESVSYVSNGKFLNVTFWLTSPIKEIPANHRPVYGLFLDADSNQDTGHGGIDYSVNLAWNTTDKKWEKSIEELSESAKSRIINQINDYKGITENTDYINLSLDLSTINNPSQYRVTFVIADYINQKNDARKARILDLTNTVNIPPPQFSMSTNPNTIELRPGEEKNIEVQIKSLNPNILVLPQVNFFSYKKDNILLNFFPNKTNMLSDNIATSNLHVKSLDNSTIGVFTLPVLTRISFPPEYFGNPSANIIENSNVTISIIKPLSLQEQLKTWLMDWFNPLTGTWTTVTTITTGILGWRIWKRQDKSNKPNENK
jgi:hypothetical protein